MASEHSFDISAKIDMQNFKNAINLVDREVTNRYDFKGTTYEVNFKEKEKLLVLIASSDNKLDALKDIVISKFLKQGLSSKVLDELKIIFPNNKNSNELIDLFKNTYLKNNCLSDATRNFVHMLFRKFYCLIF